MYYAVAAGTETAHTYVSHANDKVTAGREITVTTANLAKTVHDIYVVDQYGNDITVDGGTAGKLEVKNVKLAATGRITTTAADLPSVTWGATDTALVKITDSTTNLAPDDTFQIVVSSGTLSDTFYITIA